MKTRRMFLVALLLILGALSLVLRGRAELSQAFQAWHRGEREEFARLAAQARWLLVPAWTLAAGATVFLIASRRRQEPAWRWLVLLLLALFLLLGLLPG